MRPKDFLPANPKAGPPIPQGMGVAWPGISPRMASVNPGDPELNQLIEQKRREWTLQYSASLADMAVAWAENWAQGVMASPIYEPARRLLGQFEPQLTRDIYKLALVKADNWIQAVRK